ncbi:MAG: DUF1579 domain-containing protein [Ramlibacter sp.]|nr:DUF1579 domain-containing protein [Ramlibacter sp.]
MSAPDPDGASGFDFLLGEWQVAHQRLRSRLSGSTEWDRFAGHCAMRPVLGGLGNLDDNFIDLPGDPYRAVTLRTFDPRTARWSIWWLDGRHPDRVDVPVVGSFSAGVGTFYADDWHEGRPVRIRFLWTLPAPDQPRWEQAFSADNGATWETNWVMAFSRPTA